MSGLDRLPRIAADYEAGRRPSHEDVRWLIEQLLSRTALPDWAHGWLERHGTASSGVTRASSGAIHQVTDRTDPRS